MTDEELIKAAAEKVMGWRVHFRNTAWWVLAEEELGIVEHIQAHVHNWNPLNNEEDCWQLVNQLATVNGETKFLLERCRTVELKGMGWCGMGWYASFKNQGEASHPDRRRAIVLAALKACRVEV